jgi:hypothetical protein
MIAVSVLAAADETQKPKIQHWKVSPDILSQYRLDEDRTGVCRSLRGIERDSPGSRAPESGPMGGNRIGGGACAFLK